MAELREQIVSLVRLAVARVAAEPRDEQRFLELNFALDRAVERSVRYRDLLELSEAAAADARPDVAWAWCLSSGLSANLTGDADIAIQWLERASASPGDWHGTAANSFLHSELARAHYHRGDNTLAAESATRALQMARAANSRLAEAYAHHYLGLISLRQGDRDYARRQLVAARELFSMMNQRHGGARVDDSLANLLIDEGQYEQAERLLVHSLDVKEELRDLRGQALTWGNLARLHMAKGEFHEAVECLERERELTSRVGDERNATQVCVQLGRLHLRHQLPEEARRELLKARDMARERRDERLHAWACFSLAEAHRRLGEGDKALEAIQVACDYFAASDDRLMQTRSQLRAAILRGADLDSPEIQEPVQRLREADAPTDLANALFEVASYYHQRDSMERVAAIYAEALDAADATQSALMASILRGRAQSQEGRAWVNAMLAVKTQKDQLERAYRELSAAERLRDSLTQMIVHDLKNPLASITPWLHLIQEGSLSPDETREYIQTAIDECDILLRMIDDLNDVGRLQGGTSLDLVIGPVDVPELLGEVVRRFQHRATEARMRLRLEVQPLPTDPPYSRDLPLPPLRADRDKLRRVVENLVANALKYGRPPEGSTRPAEVILHYFTEPAPPDGGVPSIRVEIRDFGPGIPPAEAERVFEPYYQAEAGRLRKAGVGLGLTFSRMIIEAHGGTIWTEPNPEGGTVFAFRLPAEPFPSDSRPAQAAAGLRTDLVTGPWRNRGGFMTTLDLPEG